MSEAESDLSSDSDWSLPPVHAYGNQRVQFRGKYYTPEQLRVVAPSLQVIRHPDSDSQGSDASSLSIEPELKVKPQMEIEPEIKVKPQIEIEPELKIEPQQIIDSTREIDSTQDTLAFVLSVIAKRYQTQGKDATLMLAKLAGFQAIEPAQMQAISISPFESKRVIDLYRNLSFTIKSLGHMQGILSFDSNRWRFGSPCLVSDQTMPLSSDQVAVRVSFVNDLTFPSVSLAQAMQEIFARIDVWLYRRWRRIMMGELTLLADLLAGYAHRLPPWMERAAMRQEQQRAAMRQEQQRASNMIGRAAIPIASKSSAIPIASKSSANMIGPTSQISSASPSILSPTLSQHSSPSPSSSLSTASRSTRRIKDLCGQYDYISSLLNTDKALFHGAIYIPREGFSSNPNLNRQVQCYRNQAENKPFVYVLDQEKSNNQALGRNSFFGFVLDPRFRTSQRIAKDAKIKLQEVFKGPFAIIDDSNDQLVHQLTQNILAQHRNARLLVKNNDAPIQHWTPMAAWNFLGNNYFSFAPAQDKPMADLPASCRVNFDQEYRKSRLVDRDSLASLLTEVVSTTPSTIASSPEQVITQSVQQGRVAHGLGPSGRVAHGLEPSNSAQLAPPVDLPDAEQTLFLAPDDPALCAEIDLLDAATAKRLVGKQGFDCLSSRVTGASLLRLLDPRGLIDDSVLAAFGKLAQTNQTSSQPVIILDTHTLSLFERYPTEFKVKLPPLRRNELILVPANVNKNHWALFIINLATSQILLADSLLAQDPWPQKELEHVTRFVQSNISPQLDSWTKAIMRDVPQQSNAVDCGVYVMAMERALALNSALCINPSNSANFRSLLALCLKQCTLAPSIDASSIEASSIEASPLASESIASQPLASQPLASESISKTPVSSRERQAIIDTAAEAAAKTASMMAAKTASMMASQSLQTALPGMAAAQVSPLFEKAFDEIKVRVKGDSSWDKLVAIVTEQKGKNSALAQIARAMLHVTEETIKQTDGSKNYSLANETVSSMQWPQVLEYIKRRQAKSLQKQRAESAPVQALLSGVLPTSTLAPVPTPATPATPQITQETRQLSCQEAMANMLSMSQAILQDSLDTLPVLNVPWNPSLQAQYATTLQRITQQATEQTVMALWNKLLKQMQDSFQPLVVSESQNSDVQCNQGLEFVSNSLAAKSLYAKAISIKQPQRIALSLGQLLATKIKLVLQTMETVMQMPYSSTFFVPILPRSLQLAMMPLPPAQGDDRSVLMQFVESFNNALAQRTETIQMQSDLQSYAQDPSRLRQAMSNIFEQAQQTIAQYQLVCRMFASMQQSNPLIANTLVQQHIPLQAIDERTIGTVLNRALEAPQVLPLGDGFAVAKGAARLQLEDMAQQQAPHPQALHPKSLASLTVPGPELMPDRGQGVMIEEIEEIEDRPRTRQSSVRPPSVRTPSVRPPSVASLVAPSMQPEPSQTRASSVVPSRAPSVVQSVAHSRAPSVAPSVAHSRYSSMSPVSRSQSPALEPVQEEDEQNVQFEV